MPSAIQSDIMQPLQAHLDKIFLSTSKLVDVQPPTTSINVSVYNFVFISLFVLFFLVGLLATVQDILDFEVPSTDDAENYGKF